MCACLSSGRIARIALLLASAAAMPALAADASDTATELNDIVITATRSGAESLQNVPIAVSVVNIDAITKSNQGNLTDLAKFTPSLAITEGGPGFNKFNMRGLSTGGYRTSDTSDRPLVAIYLDDTPISVQGQTPDLKVYDLERVEILRGPQGTLFGAGSMAGTIRFVTAKPDAHKFFGSAEADGATTQHGAGSYNFRGMVNLPVVTDTLAVRANVYVGKDGGYIDNIGAYAGQNRNSNRTTQARVAARWTPTPDLIVDASVTYEQSRARGLNIGLSGLAPYTTSTNSAEGTSDKFRLYQLGASYNLGFADFIATAAYTDRDIGFNASPEPQIGYFFQDYTGLTPSATAYPLFRQPATYNQAITNSIPAEKYTINNKIKDFMVEGRLASKNTGAVKWTAGVFYETQKRHLIQDIPTPGFDTLSYENYFYGPFATPTGKYDSKLVDAAFSSNDIFSGLQDVDEHQLAVYADGTWHATDRLDLTAGVRYFNFEEKYYLFESGVYGVVNHIPLITNATLKSHGFNPRANIAYKVTDDLLVFAEAAKGFRYGGANQPVPTGTTGIAGQCSTNLASYGYTAAPLTFGPDKLWNYTIGEKAKLGGGRVTLNATAYWIDWQDVQTRLLLNCSYFFTANKGKITSRGLELESMVKVSPEVTLSLGGSYNDSRANGDIPTVGAFDGDRTPYFPQLVFNFGAFYDRPVGGGDLHLQLSYQYQSDQQTTFNRFKTKIVGGALTRDGDSSTFARIPETHNLSASLAYDIGNFEFGVFGNNLANGVKVTDIARATYYAIYQAGSRVTYARPRTVGGRVKVKF